MACLHGKQWIILVAFILTFLIAFFIGVAIGYLVVPAEVTKSAGGKGGGAAKDGPCLPGAPDRLVKDANDTITEKLLRVFKAENLEQNLKRLTARPHLGGTPAEYEIAEDLRRLWLDQGLDHVKLSRYRVLLSYPDPRKPNKIELLDGQDNVIHRSQLAEKILRPEQNQPGVVPPFNAYSAPGVPQGQLVYVNYGRIEDFIWLNETKKIDLTGKILIARYGKIFRGSKVQNAEKYGAKGMILYSDPADYAVPQKVDPYPNSWWLPGSGVQRGSLAILGDPLTPGYPANDAAYRIPIEEVKGLPTISVHPIGYDDAAEFLKRMSGDEAPSAWRGRLPITYRLGPGFTNTEWKVKMSISTRNQMADTHNVFGYIKGDVEPDRYVLIGNHRDAWVFGAQDPSSGTAVLMEISRGMGQLLKEGWRPRRTIIFCSWGAEEFGLVGSREYVEEFGKTLEKRVVAYLNMDTAVQGNFTFRGKVLPMLKTAMYEAAKKIPNPNPSEVAAGRKSVYDTWLKRTPQKTADGRTLNVPKLSYLGSGSDYDPFILRIGVTCVDIRYSFDPSFRISSHPLYHSIYETFHLMKSFIDPDFKYHLAVTQFTAELARSLSDSLVLPFDVMEYAKSLKDFAKAIDKGYGSLMRQNSVSLDNLNAAITNFTRAVVAFEDRVKTVNKNNPYELRLINDQMVQVERAFIDPSGLPDRPLSRHIVFAPSKHNAYAGSSFPGLVDAMFEIEKASDAAKRWIVVKKQLSLVVFTIQSATTSLADTINF